MKREDLERWLNKGNDFGFQLRDDDHVVEWVIISRRVRVHKFLERFTEADDPVAFREQMHIRDFPWQVWIAGMQRATYENCRSLSNEDYFRNESHTFHTLVEVEIFLNTSGLKLSAIKWSADIHFL